MKSTAITRSYLETLSFSDLIALADEYGIDVPEDLNRNFLIADLLEVSEEQSKDSDADMTITSDEEIAEEQKLPESYNTTEISAVLRNPAWMFVYWNISEGDLHRVRHGSHHELFLRVASYEDKDALRMIAQHEMQVSLEDKEQYIFIPAGTPFVRIDLASQTDAEKTVLAFSNIVEIPRGSPLLSGMRPGEHAELSAVEELSGMRELLGEQYNNYRQSFSE